MLQTERKAGQPADAEHRQKAQREQHRRVKADRSPHSEMIKAVRITTEGIEMIIVVVWKNAAIVVPIPVMNM